jgi:hypothetical protein
MPLPLWPFAFDDLVNSGYLVPVRHPIVKADQSGHAVVGLPLLADVVVDEYADELVAAAFRYAFLVVDEKWSRVAVVLSIGSTHEEAREKAIEQVCSLWIERVGRTEAVRRATTKCAQYEALVANAEELMSVDFSDVPSLNLRLERPRLRVRVGTS